MNPNDTLKLFKKIIAEAAELYGTTPQNVTQPQFRYVAAGRLSIERLRLIGSYATVRDYCFPNKNSKTKQDAAFAAIQRLLKNVKQAA